MRIISKNIANVDLTPTSPGAARSRASTAFRSLKIHRSHALHATVDVD
jgi:flagellar basal body rod protein FlgC